MTARTKMLLVIGVLGLPGIGFSHWVRYPTAGVPRKVEGTRDPADRRIFQRWDSHPQSDNV